MRALECDFSPHLLPDLHPYWGVLFGAVAPPVTPPRVVDIYGAHPWYTSLPQGVNPNGGVLDNPYLYYNPGSTGTPSANSWLVAYHALKVGIASPPGTGWLGTPPQRYLFAQAPTFPFDLCPSGGPHANYLTDTWGVGDFLNGCPDVAPNSGLLGVRFNCQYLGSSPQEHSNLQTFVTVNDGSGSRSTDMPPATPLRPDDSLLYRLWLDSWERVPRRRR